MPNYTLEFGVSEAANILVVGKDLLKTFAYKFSDYLSAAANPPKGQPRMFSLSDIRVLAYAAFYWCDDPDIEDIRIGLNRGHHHDHELIDKLLDECTPLFFDPLEHLNEGYTQGVLHEGLAEIADAFVLANSYKNAGDRLVDTALANDEALELYLPAIYCYRHAVELYLKAVTGKTDQTHDLNWLFQAFKKRMETDFGQTPPEWFEDIIAVFADFDPYGVSFRYGGSYGGRGEIVIDLPHVKLKMSHLSTSFQNIRRAQGMPDANL